LWHPNEKIVRFSPLTTIIFLLVNFGKHSQRIMLNPLPPTVPRLPITRGALPQPQLNQFPAITAAPFRFREQLSPITHFTQKGKKTSDFFILMPRRNFLTALTFFNYPHKFPNLSFNLAVLFFSVIPRTKNIF
jgi:hypothetical protein